MKNLNMTPAAKRRSYYLHKKVKEKGFDLRTRIRTIFLKHGADIVDEHLIALRDEFKYSIQYGIV